MLIVDTALERLESEGRSIRVAVIGAGFQGAAIVRQITRSTQGMRVVGLANRNRAKATNVLSDLSLEFIECEGRAEIVTALDNGQVAATSDAISLAEADGVDVVVEVTGSVEHAAAVALAAINAGKHFINMNAELDGTLGPLLSHRAQAAGVIYSFSDGDQPGVQMNLFRFVRGIGAKPVLCGNIKGLHDPYRNPQTQRAFAERWGQKPAMVASFADGTKISFEQAVVANGTGFKVAQRGMLGPDFSNGDPTAPLVPLEDTIQAFAGVLDRAETGLVDYVVGARPGPGVFVVATMDDPRQRHFLNLYKLGMGPYYCFQTPYHLCHFEVPNSVARAALFTDPVLRPSAGPVVGVVASAKKDLAPGETITEFGGFEAYGVAENYDVIESQRLLPMGLALGTRLVRSVGRDQVLTWEDVSLPQGSLAVDLYQEQRALFPLPKLQEELCG